MTVEQESSTLLRAPARTPGYAVLTGDEMTYTFEEIQRAWNEAGIDGDWLEFVAHLGVTTTDDKKYCGDCAYGTGEECNGPGGSREGQEVYSTTPACDCYYKDEDCPTPEIFPGTLDALRKLGGA